MLAYEEAVRHYERALRALDLAAEPLEARRCELLIGRGEAERLAGNPAYRETLFEAARLAQELGDAERLGRAALANYRGFFSATAGVDRDSLICDPPTTRRGWPAPPSISGVTLSEPTHSLGSFSNSSPSVS